MTPSNIESKENQMTRLLALTAAAATTAVTLLVAAPANAAPSIAASGNAADGQLYSQHVRDCQASMGFTGDHNPGVMHQGYSGWDPNHTC